MQFGMNRKETSQWNRERQHPRVRRHLGDDLVDQMGGGFGHAPPAARGENVLPLGREGHQLLLRAAVAGEAQEALGENVACQKRVELVDDQCR